MVPIGVTYAVAVYPFVHGVPRQFGRYESREDRVAVLEHLVELHRSPPECRSQAQTDTLAISHRNALDDAMREMSRPWGPGPFAQQAKELLLASNTFLSAAFDRYDVLVRRVKARPERITLTHGEPHPGNTMLTDKGLVLIDWDTTLLAPPERDLWSIVAEDPSMADWYAEHSGTSLDAEALDLYRLAWDLTDVALYVNDLRAPHDRTDDTTAAWSSLQYCLSPDRW